MHDPRPCSTEAAVVCKFIHFYHLTEKIERTVQIEASTVEIEERGVKLRLTVVDTPGYGDAINSQDWYEIIYRVNGDEGFWMPSVSYVILNIGHLKTHVCSAVLNLKIRMRRI